MIYVHRVILVLVLGCALYATMPQVYAQTPVVQPQAALIVIAPDDSRSLVIDLGDARNDIEQLALPPAVHARALPDSPLPRIVAQLMVPSISTRYLLLKGEATATPAPTQTPYVPRPMAQFTLQDAMVLTSKDAALGARFVQLTCAQCDPTWPTDILNMLPPYAPIVVYAPGAVQLSGAALIQILPVTSKSSVPALGDVVHLFERLPDAQLASPTWRTGTVSAATYPPKRMVEVDGRMTLLRVVLCLVAVLFSSIASFYLSMAVLRRMHAAVGYKPEQ